MIATITTIAAIVSAIIWKPAFFYGQVGYLLETWRLLGKET